MPSGALLFFFQAEDGIRDLTVTGVQTCALPILRHGALEHDRDDFHVAVRVRRKARARGDEVLVQHAERAELDVCRIVIAVERETVPRIEPAVVGVASLRGSSNRDHGLPPWP